MSKRTNKLFDVQVAAHGWMVVEADNPQEALEIARKYANNYITEEDFKESEIEVVQCEPCPKDINDIDNGTLIFCKDEVVHVDEYALQVEEENSKKPKWKSYPGVMPSVSGEYLVRGIGGLNNKLHYWVCLWVGDCDDKTIAHRFFYGGNEFRNVTGKFEWLDLKEL